METMDIVITPALEQFIQRRVEERGYGSVSEYVRDLIQRDQQQSAQFGLEYELLEGLASGPPEKMTEGHWAEIRAEVQQRVASRRNE